MRISLIVVILLTSFHPSAPDANAQGMDKKAAIVIYRIKGMTAKLLDPSVYCDAREVAYATNGRYFTLFVDAGKHAIESNDEKTVVTIDAKAGETYFVNVAMGKSTARSRWGVWGAVSQVSKEVAMPLILKLKPLDAKRVLEKAAISIDPIR